MQIGQYQLGGDGLDVPFRRDIAVQWLTSGSVKTRTTWQIASVSRMWAGN